MPFIKWKPAYETGIPKVDEQHKELVALINKLERATQSKRAETVVEEVLVKLVYYIRFHFSEEEKLMAESRYPDINRHAKLHLTFTHRVAKLLMKLKENEIVSVGEILPFLKSWLMDHILKEDIRMADAIIKPVGAKPSQKVH